jgi:phosphoglycerate dehydrogenase-like enzyme
MVNAAFFSDNAPQINRVYGEGRKEWLQTELDFFLEIVSSESFARHLPALQQVEFVFSTWGMLQLNEEQIAQLPALKAVFYAAGSVQYFARPFLTREVKVLSAWGANAVPVAQFTVAQIILAAKGYFMATRICCTSAGRNSFNNHYPGLFRTRISLLGAGMVGTKVIELLKPYALNILVFDPFLSQERADELGVERVSLEQAFQNGFVVSNHLANLPETRQMLTRSLFESLQPYATFINTGRGATVDEASMLAVLAQRPDLTALLDVTEPEPPQPDSPIYQLENVLLSPHIAGSIDREVLRQADYMLEEYRRFKNGEPLLYSVSLEMLKTMA